MNPSALGLLPSCAKLVSMCGSEVRRQVGEAVTSHRWPPYLAEQFPWRLLLCECLVARIFSPVSFRAGDMVLK